MKTFVPPQESLLPPILHDEDIADLYISTFYLFRKVEDKWLKDKKTYSEEYSSLKRRLKRLEWLEFLARKERLGF